MQVIKAGPEILVMPTTGSNHNIQKKIQTNTSMEFIETFWQYIRKPIIYRILRLLY